MMTDKKQLIAERNESIRTGYKSGRSLADLSGQFGLSKNMIYNIVKDISRDDRVSVRKGKRTREQRGDLGALHRRIGGLISMKVTGELDQRFLDFSTQVRMSRSRIRDITSGVADMTIGELQRLADFFGIEVWQLILSPDDQKALERGRDSMKETTRGR